MSSKGYDENKPLFELTEDEIKAMVKDLKKEFGDDFLDGIMGLEAIYKFAVSEENAELRTQLFNYIKQQKGKTLRDFMRQFTKTATGSEEEDAIVHSLAERFAAGFNDYLEKQGLKQYAQPIRIDSVDFPLDKINSRVWDLLEQGADGQIGFNLAGPANAPAEKQAPAYYAINFDALDEDEGLRQLTKRLTPFDKRVYIAVSALFSAGNSAMTFTQIHYATGNENRPNKTQLQRIENSVVKMMRALVIIDDTQAAKKLGYEAFTRQTNLLHAVIDKGIAYNGTQSKAQLRVMTEPTLISYAKRRHQITTVPLRLLQGPFNKTDSFIAIQDYLLETIAHAKRGHKKSVRLTFDTICERTHQTDRKQRERTPEKVETVLEHFKTEEWIAGYTTDKNGVSVQL